MKKRQTNKLALSSDDKLKIKVWRLHSIGVPPVEIAKRLKIKQEEVANCISEIVKNITDVLSKKTAIEMTAELLNRYDYLFYLCLEEFEGTNSSQGRAALLKVATSINKNKEDLLKDTGLIPKEPQKMEHTVKGRIQHEIDISPEEERSDEEIAKSIENLLKHGLVLGQTGETIDVEYEEKEEESGQE